MSDDNGRNHNGGRPDNPAHLHMYLGPYERWNFGVGRDYALPFMRDNWTYISALAERGHIASPGGTTQRTSQGWVPTLWDDALTLRFIPFVVKNRHHKMPSLKQLRSFLRDGLDVATDRLLQAHERDETNQGRQDASRFKIPYSRYRIAFPVSERAMHTSVEIPTNPPWLPDDGLRNRIDRKEKKESGKKKITVMAVIDDGIPFAHRNFRDVTGTRTRVEFCWLQSVAFDPNQKSVLFGREYTRQNIEDLIARHGDDEDVLYRTAGATEDTEGLGSPIDRHASHGAHVMDLATGYTAERGRPGSDGSTPDEEPREEIRLIAVQLPNTIAWDTSGFGKDMYMLSAFHYIFHRADMLAKGYCERNLRLVINFSYGFSGGRHDGQTELEAAIDELVDKRRKRKSADERQLLGPSPTALVLPAGNTFLDRLHGVIRDEDFRQNAAMLHWRIQPNDRTPSYLEIWFSHGFDPKGFRIELWDSWGKLQSSIDIQTDGKVQKPAHGDDPTKFGAVLNAAYQPVGQISVDRHRADDPDGARKTGRYRVLIVMAPTEPEAPRLPRADAGKWTVVIRRGVFEMLNYPIHCWIQRSADPESLRSGSRQSYFDECADEASRYTAQGDLSETDTCNSFVRRFGSLNGLATGRTALVVGGYQLGAGLASSLARARPARYSSAGALREKGEYWPDKQVNASSMSERARVLPGTIAAGVRSGSLSLVEGTSSAAPFVARQLAEVFAEKEYVCAEMNDNYLSLLCGYHPDKGETITTDEKHSNCPKDDSELVRARLGIVLVPPHWQPGIELRTHDPD